MHSLKIRQLLSFALVTAVIGGGVTAGAAEITPFTDTMSRDTTSVAGSQEKPSAPAFLVTSTFTEENPPIPTLASIGNEETGTASKNVLASNLQDIVAGESPSDLESDSTEMPLMTPPVMPSIDCTACDDCNDNCPKKRSRNFSFLNRHDCNVALPWLELDLLGWWVQPMDTPVLATRAPRGSTGALGNADTTIVYGGKGILDDIRLGLRVRGGFWFDCCKTHGIEADYIGLSEENDKHGAVSGGLDTFSRPYIDAITNTNNVEFVAFLPTAPNPLAGSGAIAGGLLIGAESNFSMAGARFVRNLRKSCCGSRRLDALVGYRYASLDDRVTIGEDLTSIDPSLPATHFDIADDFQSSNTFHGADIGLRLEKEMRRWSFTGILKMALGNTRQQIDINGQTVTTDMASGTSTTTAGGLLTQPSNIGSYQRDRFAIIPECEFQLGYRVNCNLKANIGYNFMYWSDVTRAGTAIDPVVNTNFLPGASGPTTPARPEFAFDSHGVWLQGLDLGLEWCW